MQSSANTVICGAGIAGAAAAFHLSKSKSAGKVVVIDSREPFTLTSDKGTQGYRNWWPGPDDTMFKLVSRSIDLLEESAMSCENAFRLNRRGYLFATSQEKEFAKLVDTARTVSGYGMGEVRFHDNDANYERARAEGFASSLTGVDILTGNAVHEAFPHLSSSTIAAVHVRRAGWLNSVAFGSWLLQQSAAAGVSIVRDRVVGVDTTGGAVKGVLLSSGDRISCESFVAAAGPELPEIAKLLDIRIPVFHELHSKLTFRDSDLALPRDLPFVIWCDAMQLDWSNDERLQLVSESGGEKLLGVLPGGVHLRPADLANGDELYLIWTYETQSLEYSWPPTFSDWYGRAVLRGASVMLPALRKYVGNTAIGRVDGGYYCKTKENRPLVGPLEVKGAYVIGALSGSGLMSAHACGELIAAHVTSSPLPEYARWLLPSRFSDPSYQKLVSGWDALSGQL